MIHTLNPQPHGHELDIIPNIAMPCEQQMWLNDAQSPSPCMTGGWKLDASS
ncbi:hypothetical protein I79_010359 [Cricetulus griseus]|uniref:Uncharacterized protein n=1 Tax=Cricetulus griseus TaxID=10029 RepID=G3HI92_CRIGR|nr:hypothetical protein I79_010359 [Cricetulus griseus]